MQAGPPGRIAAWVAAARPKTLSASVAPVLLGSAFAARDGGFRLLPALLALLGAVLIQVGTNLANDYFDHRRGADAQRVGPARASASGWLQPRAVRNAAYLSFLLAALVGIGLVALAGWPILLIGLASLAAGYAYTAGPYPLAYHGWGETFVFVFFGLVAVAGTYYVQAGPPPFDAIVAGAAPGALSSAVLVVNNRRDRATDARVGKNTLAVRLGERGTILEYAVLLVLAHAATVAVAWKNPGAWLGLLTLPWAAFLVVRFARARDPASVGRFLAPTSGLLLAHCACFAAGVVLW